MCVCVCVWKRVIYMYELTCVHVSGEGKGCVSYHVVVMQ